MPPDLFTALIQSSQDSDLNISENNFESSNENEDSKQKEVDGVPSLVKNNKKTY